ncbi:MAG: 5'-nucleotidase C-terminal domain-containing protein [Chitinophagaceae bacterium]
MKRFSLTIFPVITVAVFFVSCHKQFQPQSVQYAGYSVDQSKTDTSLINLLKPYSAKVGETMNDVLAELSTSLKKEQPDGSLGNFLADAYLSMAQKKFDPAADLAFMNNGGIRLNTIQAGPLRRGSIYEVMPFDNLMVILKLTGAQLQQYLDYIAAEGGSGIAGLRMTIRDKKATDVYIGNNPLNLTATYTMVNSDYAVNGGGGYTMLKELPMQKTGYLLRDAILDYCAGTKAAGKSIFVSAEKRIINGN